MGVLQTHTPDVIVCDIGMPEEDGYSLIRRIRSRPGQPGQIPAAALTAWTDVADEPLAGVEDQVVVTPTLVKRSPSPRAWVVGDLSDHNVVISLLDMAGVERGQAEADKPAEL
jgi:CheY-like chemotaxis protein